MSNVTGTSRMTYKPGEKLPESQPVEPGVYSLQLVEFGKKGRAGWAAKPGKFHNRRLVFEILDTQDELTGLPKKVSEFFTLGPKNLFRVLNFAQAAQYPEEITLDTGYSKPGAPQSLANADAIDELLEWAKSSKLTFKAQIGVDEYQGREQNRIQRWLDNDDADSEGVEESAEEGASEEQVEETAEALDEAPSEESGEEAAEESDDSETDDEPAPKSKVVQGPIGDGKSGKVTPVKKGILPPPKGKKK